MRNKALFFKIAKQIEDDPVCFNQNTWGSSCGTTHCIAGWSAALSGYTPIDDEDDTWGKVSIGCSDNMNIQDVAQRLLGISSVEAVVLFSYNWKPVGATVADAMRFFGRGGNIA